MINAAAGEHHASLEIVSLQIRHFRQNLRRIKPGREQVQNVADTNSHPAHARPPAALPGIHGDSIHQVFHICKHNAPGEPQSQSSMAPPANAQAS